MRDYIEVGSAPAEEDCVQVTRDGDYHEAMRAECKRFIALIRSTLGPEPDGARLAVKGFPHDFGTYYEVVCYFDDSNEEAEAYAYRCEDEAPTRWTEYPMGDGSPCLACGEKVSGGLPFCSYCG